MLAPIVSIGVESGSWHFRAFRFNELQVEGSDPLALIVCLGGVTGLRDARRVATCEVDSEQDVVICFFFVS